MESPLVRQCWGGVLKVADALSSTHSEAVWRERADFIIQAKLPEEGRFEQLWARQLAPDEFELCCIPFFLYDVSLGDVVATDPRAERRYVLNRVVRRSGRSVLRAFFDRASYRYRDLVSQQIADVGGLMEWSSPSLLAIDGRDDALATSIEALLREAHSAGQLIYERGRQSAGSKPNGAEY